jgi:tetratricopeptide (TPR) repeat protein
MQPVRVDRRRTLRWLTVVGALVTALVIGGGLLGGHPGPARRVADIAALPASTRDRLAGEIARTQAHLRVVPGDYVSWAGLGLSYLELARSTSDPTYYPKADGALRQSLRLRPADNATAMAGLGALANARHDFATARDWARRTIAIDPYSADAFAVLTDAETQLGHRSAATVAVQRMLDLRPGLPALTRAAYDLEQRGQVGQAAALLHKALDDAVDPSALAYCHQQLGDLAWHSGDLTTASREYQAGLDGLPGYPPLLLGQARVAQARGQTAAALDLLGRVTRDLPNPGTLIEYADALRAAGRVRDAADQLALADASLKLTAANGGLDDLTGSALALERGDPTTALGLARREWQRRQHADVADALGWALHEAGHDGQALTYARLATGTGARSAGYAFHQAMIELSLGRSVDARRNFAQALGINPYFSPIDAPVARQALAGLRWSR